MAEDLLSDFEKIKLNEEESKVIGDQSVELEDEGTKNQIALSMVGKLLTSKPFNAEAMKRTLKSVWRLHDKVVIKTVEMNLFVFQFFREKDKEKVLDGCPWFFDGKLLVLKEVNGEEQPSEVTFNHTPLWIRLLDVPFSKRNRKTLTEIGDFLGTFLETDDTEPLGWGEFMRVKVMIDIEKPLRRGLFLAVGAATSKWVPIKYERLEEFCLFCGRLDHTESGCVYKEEARKAEFEIVYQYGPWLRASPRRLPRNLEAEIEKEKRWKEELYSMKKKRTPSYHDPEAVKLGPPGVACKLSFPPPKAKKATLISVVDPLTSKALLRIKSIHEGLAGDEKMQGAAAELFDFHDVDSQLRSDTRVCKPVVIWKRGIAHDGENRMHNEIKADGKGSKKRILGDFSGLDTGLAQQQGNKKQKLSKLLIAGDGCDECSLKDLGYEGSWVTWERGNVQDGFVRERLDRFVACAHWCAWLSQAHVAHLTKFKSDHVGIFLDTEARGLRK
uniref:DUF4283 domain-containing protein n=1 Tax=Chenopodium quinoa TaxID=63459 RepID=A0A803KRS5_CHEQI